MSGSSGRADAGAVASRRGAPRLPAFAVTTASAQQPQRVRGTIEKVDGNTLSIKSPTGAPVTLTLTPNAAVVGVLKASIADIKEGSYIGSGAMPQPSKFAWCSYEISLGGIAGRAQYTRGR